MATGTAGSDTEALCMEKQIADSGHRKQYDPKAKQEDDLKKERIETQLLLECLGTYLRNFKAMFWMTNLTFSPFAPGGPCRDQQEDSKEVAD